MQTFAMIRHLVCIPLLLLATGLSAAEPAMSADEASVFARVGEQAITLEAYQAALQAGMRTRFYHGKVPEGTLASYQREIGEDIVRRTLLLQEAARRKLEADGAWVEERLTAFDRRKADNPDWVARREELLPELRLEVEKQSQLQILEQQVRDSVPEPNRQQTQDYYRAHPDLFTEPEQYRASILLLKVDPSSPTQVWDLAQGEAENLFGQLREGADFVELARRHSGDRTAEQGGDMGYLHQGMLASVAEEALAALQPGEITPPLRLLEGIAIFRLEERRQARLNTFDEVQERVGQLWLREQRDQAWQNLYEQLRATTPIEVREDHYLPLPAPSRDQQSGPIDSDSSPAN